jgi:glutamate synthase domain-containing protein 3
MTKIGEFVPFTIDCGDQTVRAINQAIRAAVASGRAEIEVKDPAARHNLAVALPEGVRITIDGSAGYYVGGLNDGAHVIVRGAAGWGAGESMRDGTIVVEGNVGNAVAASIRSGTVIVRGDASTRAGIAMKGGTLVVAGNVGPMAAFMMQKGRLIVCGDAADGLADSMYSGTVFLGGRIDQLGADAIFEDVTAAEQDILGATLDQWKVAAPANGFRKIIAGKRLWNFQKSERELWRSAL